MKRRFRIFYVLLFLVLSISFACAIDNSEEVVFLQNEHTINLDTPCLGNLEHLISDLNYTESEKMHLSNSESNMFESKAGQAFCRFVNNRVVNNQFNLFSMYFGEEQKNCHCKAR